MVWQSAELPQMDIQSATLRIDYFLQLCKDFPAIRNGKIMLIKKWRKVNVCNISK
jgi:hypothetical protein